MILVAGEYCNKMDEARPRNLDIWEIVDLEQSKKCNLPKSKSIMPKMVARSTLVGTKTVPGPLWGHFKQIVPWAGNMQTLNILLPIFPGGPMAAIQPVWAQLIRKNDSVDTRSRMVGASVGRLKGWSSTVNMVKDSTDGEVKKNHHSM